MRYFILPLVLAACSNPMAAANDRLDLEYRVGEELMNDCNLRGERCAEWLAFKSDFEKSTSYLTTFERSLAQHKARQASHGA